MPAERVQVDERLVGDARVAAFGRLLAGGNPSVHGHQQRPEDGSAVVQRIAWILADATIGRAAAQMLSAGHHVNPHMRIDVEIALAFHIRVNQRGCAGPVFRSTLGEEELGHLALRLGTRQQVPLLSGDRIGLGHAGEREGIDRREEVFVLGGAGRHDAEPLGEQASAA